MRILKMKSKKGSVMDGIIWIVIAFVTLLMLALLVYIYDAVYVGFNSVGMVGNVNVTNITDVVFLPAKNGMVDNLNMIGFIIIVGGALSILLHNFLVRMHPAWFIVYVLMTIMAVIVSAFVSNMYMSLLSNDVLGSTLSQFTMGNFIMQWLPYWSVVIGILGAIFLFIGVLRDQEFSGGVA